MPIDLIPSFRKPPVVETVLSVAFGPLEHWGMVHYGLFWEQIRQAFPKQQDQQPLTLDIESYQPSVQPHPTSVQFDFGAQPEARCWFVSEDDHQLLQLQRDRFIYNWRRIGSDSEYPRYDAFVRPAFESNWAKYVSFLEQEGLDAPEVVQCEVTYVNHILQGEGWNEPKDWENVFTFVRNVSNPTFLPSPESLRLNYAYLMPDQKGRLRVTAQRALRQSDGKEIIALSLVARGKPASSRLPDLLEWFNDGREWIVRGFADITSDAMHKVWKREA